MRVHKVAEAQFPSEYGEFIIMIYRETLDGDKFKDHLVLLRGNPNTGAPLVRVHSQCLTGDTLGSLRCDCGLQLDKALRMIGKEESGILIYLMQEGRGIGLANKIKAYALQDRGVDTVEANHQLGFAADLRTYDVAGRILADLGVCRIRLLTNNPDKIIDLAGMGIEIVERVPLEVEPNEYNRDYLAAKKRKLGHLLSVI
ncbi:MAG: GTP cyclohydrolase II [candidate division WOR-3 bacterium]